MNAKQRRIVIWFFVIGLFISGCASEQPLAPTHTPTLAPTSSLTATSTFVPTPTLTPIPPTVTPLPPTATLISPTTTPIPPTATSIPPTTTPIPPTPTLAPSEFISGGETRTILAVERSPNFPPNCDPAVSWMTDPQKGCIWVAEEDNEVLTLWLSGFDDSELDGVYIITEGGMQHAVLTQGRQLFQGEVTPFVAFTVPTGVGVLTLNWVDNPLIPLP